MILLETLKPYEVVADRVAGLLPKSPAAIVFLEEGIRNGGAGMLTFDMLRKRHEKLMRNKNTDIVAIDDNFVIPTQNESIRRTAGITMYCVKPFICLPVLRRKAGQIRDCILQSVPRSAIIYVVVNLYK